MVSKIQLDMSDPENPIAKVREAHVAFVAVYKGEDAWNQNILVMKLRNDLTKAGWSIRSYHLDSAYDKDGQRISEEEMKQYIYRKHGHDGTHGCSSCPDPLKWKEVEKLRMKEYYKKKEVLDDPKRGRIKGYNWATGEIAKKKEIVYVLETPEEREKRLSKEKSLKLSRGNSKKKEHKNNGYEEEQQRTPDPEFEPTLQFRTT